MKNITQIKHELDKELKEANRLLKQSIESKNESDRNMYLRLYSKVQERIMTLEWVLK